MKRTKKRTNEVCLLEIVRGLWRCLDCPGEASGDRTFYSRLEVNAHAAEHVTLGHRITVHWQHGEGRTVE